MEAAAAEYIATIDRMGGMIAAIDQGYPQKEIADAAYRYQLMEDRREKITVGVNKYVTEDETPLEILRISAEVEREQRAELARRRAARDQEAVAAALDALTAAAATDDNLIPRLVDAARVEATVGEMAAALKEVWGEYTEPPRF
jgi:methylmalonyl-CoA mutase N-terminal domain/subunit